MRGFRYEIESLGISYPKRKKKKNLLEFLVIQSCVTCELMVNIDKSLGKNDELNNNGLTIQ